MGGEGSGRRPDPVKQYVEMRTPIATTPVSPPIIIPNYSGIQDAAKKGSSGLTSGMILYANSSGTITGDLTKLRLLPATNKLGTSLYTSSYLQFNATGAVLLSANNTLTLGYEGITGINIPNTGLVGINCTDPVAQLEVRKAGTSDPLVRLGGTASTDSISVALAGTGTTGGKWFYSGAADAFLTGTAQGDTGMTFTTGKTFKIGIQGSTAAYSFNADTLTINTILNATRGLSLNDGTNTLQVTPSFGSNGIPGVGSGTSTDLCFRTNLTEKVRITSGGNVGIGIVNPAHILEAIGTVVTSGASCGFKINTSAGISAAVTSADLVGKTMTFSGGILIGYA